MRAAIAAALLFPVTAHADTGPMCHVSILHGYRGEGEAVDAYCVVDFYQYKGQFDQNLTANNVFVGDVYLVFKKTLCVCRKRFPFMSIYAKLIETALSNVPSSGTGFTAPQSLAARTD